MKKASTTVWIALAFALVATAAFASPASEGEAAAATAEREMVRDPSTGEMISAPQYGGQLIVAALRDEPPHADTWWGVTSMWAISPVLEKLGMVDWAVDRDEWDLKSGFTPLDVVQPHLAESYETPDPLTFIFHLRPGVRWHDKAPMNGRELVAEDIVFNYHRMTGLGSGFSEKSPYATNVSELPFESITAPDKYTVVFKLNQLSFDALDFIYFESHEAAWIYPPEVIKEHGNAQDWRNLVGTGPYELADWVDGSSIPYTRNPNYWKFDEKFPDNRLPYTDEITQIYMPDASTKLAALRSGQIALLRDLSLDQAETLERTNPELVTTSGLHFRSKGSFAMDVRNPPFDDIRVRRAMQMAIDVEAINETLYGGLGWTSPLGLIGEVVLGFYTPFEEWPEEVKQYYQYDPERAKQLLADAGYPDGFKTTLEYPGDGSLSDVEYAQIAKDYFAQIGVDVEIKIIDVPTFVTRINEHTYEGMTAGQRGTNYYGLNRVGEVVSNHVWNFSGLQDAKMDALVEEATNASSYEEMRRLVLEADQYYVSLIADVWGPQPPVFHFWQPWLGGYSGEYTLGGGMITTVLTRLWIEQELKESMGH